VGTPDAAPVAEATEDDLEDDVLVRLLEHVDERYPAPFGSNTERTLGRRGLFAHDGHRWPPTRAVMLVAGPLTGLEPLVDNDCTVVQTARYRDCGGLVESTQLTVRRDESYILELWRAQGGLPSWFLLRLLGGQGMLAAFLLLIAGWIGPGLLALTVGVSFEVLYWATRSTWFAEARRSLGRGWAADVRITDEALVHSTTRERTIVPWSARMGRRSGGVTVWTDRQPLIVPLNPEQLTRVDALRARARGAPARIRIVGPRVSPRMKMLLALAAARGPDGPTQLLYALLCDPVMVDLLADEGFDPELLEVAAGQPAAGQPEDGDSDWFAGFVDWLYENREMPLTMADLLVRSRELPDLDNAWALARGPVEDRDELVPMATEDPALVLYNDDATPLDFVADRIREVTGLGTLEAVRLAMVAHDTGEVRVAVPRPDRAARSIRRLARRSGYPLSARASTALG